MPINPYYDELGGLLQLNEETGKLESDDSNLFDYLQNSPEMKQFFNDVDAFNQRRLERNRIWNILYDKKNNSKNFVDRIKYPENFPTLKDKDGSISTHSMSWNEVDGKYYVYPTVIMQDDNTLIRLDDEAAWKHAINNNEFIEFDKSEDADWFSKNYKKYWEE